MKRISTKLSAAEARDEVNGPAQPARPKYPYGLTLRIDEKLLDKLKLDEVEVGAEVTIEARGEIVAYRESEHVGQDRTCDVEIQIVELGIEEAPDKRRARKRAAHLDKVGQ